MNDYLQTLSNQGAISTEFKQRLHMLSIDQIKHEEQIVDQAIGQAQANFSEGQMRDKKDRYQQVCTAHKEVYAEEGIIDNLQRDHKEYLKRNQVFQSQLHMLDVGWIQAKTDAIQDSFKNLDKVIDYANISNILN